MRRSQRGHRTRLSLPADSTSSDVLPVGGTFSKLNNQKMPPQGLSGLVIREHTFANGTVRGTKCG